MVIDADGDGSASVVLGGSASSDPDGGIVSWSWSEAGSAVASGETAAVSLPLGLHNLELEVTDGPGEVATDTLQVVVDDRFSGNDTAVEAVILAGSTTGTTYDNLFAYLAWTASSAGDWFSVDLPAAGSLDVTVSFLNADGDLDLRLVDSDGSSVLDSSLSTGDGESVSAAGLAAGTYLVCVSASVLNANSYSLTLMVSGAPGLAVGFSQASASEGAGTLAGVGTVTASEAPAADLSISLTSSAPGRAQRACDGHHRGGGDERALRPDPPRQRQRRRQPARVDPGHCLRLPRRRRRSPRARRRQRAPGRRLGQRRPDGVGGGRRWSHSRGAVRGRDRRRDRALHRCRHRDHWRRSRISRTGRSSSRPARPRVPGASPSRTTGWPKATRRL